MWDGFVNNNRNAPFACSHPVKSVREVVWVASESDCGLQEGLLNAGDVNEVCVHEVVKFVNFVSQPICVPIKDV